MRISILYRIERFARDARNHFIKKYIKHEDPYGEIRKEQDQLFKLNFSDCNKMIVFINFERNDFCGGIMALFHLAEISRQMKYIHGCEVIHANFFSRHGICYSRQTRFKNKEYIYRLQQVMNQAGKMDTLIFHVPEILMEDFAKSLTYKHKRILKRIPNLQINVLNQNIECFSPPSTWSSLWKLTGNITQTTGFDKYTTQEVCDFYCLPLYRLIGYNALHENYGKSKLENKEKLIIYSHDPHPMKEQVLAALKIGLPDFKLQQIEGLTFDEFMETAQRAMFSLSFGEGFDGYFTTIYFVGGLGLAVYNETFFPTSRYLDFPTVYLSYEDLVKNIVSEIRYLLENPRVYQDVCDQVEALNVEYAYNKKLTYDLLEKFYRKKSTYLPRATGSQYTKK